MALWARKQGRDLAPAEYHPGDTRLPGIESRRPRSTFRGDFCVRLRYSAQRSVRGQNRFEQKQERHREPWLHEPKHFNRTKGADAGS